MKSTTPWFNNWLNRQVQPALLALILLGMLSGCQKDVVHQRSIAELNQKAQSMLHAGDINGAVSRLEAAHDLQPDEPNTTYNLAVAYQMQGDYDKAIQMFTLLLDKSSMDKAELQKAIGITYEAKADKISAKVAAAQEDPKTDKTALAQDQADARQNYEMALAYYQKAVGSLKNPGDVQKQITDLEAKLSGNEQALTR